MKWKAPASCFRGFLCLKNLSEKRPTNGDLKCIKNAIIPRRGTLLYFIATKINTLRARLGWFRIWWFCVESKGTGDVGCQIWVAILLYFLWTSGSPKQACVVITVSHSSSFLSSLAIFPVTPRTQWSHAAWPHSFLFRVSQRWGWF